VVSSVRPWLTSERWLQNLTSEDAEGVNKFAWFFFTLITKSMAFHLHHTDRLRTHSSPSL
jgi:hypothetical protein